MRRAVLPVSLLWSAEPVAWPAPSRIPLRAFPAAHSMSCIRRQATTVHAAYRPALTDTRRRQNIPSQAKPSQPGKARLGQAKPDRPVRITGRSGGPSRPQAAAAARPRTTAAATRRARVPAGPACLSVEPLGAFANSPANLAAATVSALSSGMGSTISVGLAITFVPQPPPPWKRRWSAAGQPHRIAPTGTLDLDMTHQ